MSSLPNSLPASATSRTPRRFFAVALGLYGLGLVISHVVGDLEPDVVGRLAPVATAFLSGGAGVFGMFSGIIAPQLAGEALRPTPYSGLAAIRAELVALRQRIDECHVDIAAE